MIKIGVVGCRRGRTMMRYCIKSSDAVLTAICDFDRAKMEKEKASYGRKGKDVRLFTDFDTFLKEGNVDAVVLANYGNDHAPYAIKCLKAGKHVLSELLAVETMKEAVELCESIEDEPTLRQVFFFLYEHSFLWVRRATACRSTDRRNNGDRVRTKGRLCLY